MQAARNVDPKLEQTSDALLLDAGRGVCADLDDGVDFPTVVNNSLTGAGGAGAAEQLMVGAIVGAAIPTLCPQHQSAADAFQSSL